MSFAGKMVGTFSACIIADIATDAILHPGQKKLDYGIFNTIGQKPVGDKFWGTRTEHILGVASILSVTENLSEKLFTKRLKIPLCVDFNPVTYFRHYVAHSFFYIWIGVSLHCIADAAWNPNYKDEERTDIMKKELQKTFFGISLGVLAECFIEFFLTKRLSNPGLTFHWLSRDLIPAIFAYGAIKAAGWQDFGSNYISDFEKKMNEH